MKTFFIYYDIYQIKSKWLRKCLDVIIISLPLPIDCIFLKQNNRFIVFHATNIAKYITEIHRERLL